MTPQDKVEEIVSLYFNTDMTNREIAERVLGRRSKESTVRDIVKRHGQPKEDGQGPRILIFDIETAPMMSYHFGMWKQNIGLEQKINNSFVLCWAAKWLNDDKIMTSSTWQHHDGETREDDFECIQELALLLDEADIVVAHNGNRFDIPVLKTRMIKHGMRPLTPYKSVDTCLIAKKEFRFSSNSLDSIAEFLGCQRKISHSGFKLWREVMESKPEAQDEMLEYNIGDIVTLEEVYLRLRAWDSKAPNAALWYPNAVPRCGCCGSTEMIPLRKNATTNVSMFPALQCGDCGKVMRTGENLKDAAQRKNILRNVKV